MANPIDYIFRYDPDNPRPQPIPPDARAAKEELEGGNRRFSEWVEACRTGDPSGRGTVIRDCSYLGEVMGWDRALAPTHTPFAIVVGCSDARVPLEMVLGQGPNSLFVVRVAGNVVDSAGQGSIDYAVDNLTSGLRTIVVLGHARCGAVTGAVDAFLNPDHYWSYEATPPLRSILRRMFVAVRAAANALRQRHGAGVEDLPGYRQGLIRAAVYLNAAQSAHEIRQVVQEGGKDVPVLYGVYNLHNGLVGMPAAPDAMPNRETMGLAPAPFHPQEFGVLAERIIACLDPELLRMGESWTPKDGATA